jgi:adenylate cyclase class 2
MSIEIEAKMRLADMPGLLHRLNELDAQEVDTLEELNSFFDDADGKLKATDQGLRVRIERRPDGSRTTVITHKGPRAHGKLKSRTETEVTVHDARDAVSLLQALGYRLVLTFEKRRRRFELDGCRVELDQLPHVGRFVEIEGPSEADVLAVREKLNLATEPLIKASYIALLRTHLDRQGITDTVIRLDPDTDDDADPSPVLAEAA